MAKTYAASYEPMLTDEQWTKLAPRQDLVPLQETE